MDVVRFNLFSEVKHYIRLSKELQERLSKNPDDWPKFQETFNASVDEVARDLLQFERDNIVKNETKVYQLKKIFEKRYRHYFLYGEYPKWTFEKPLGYPGDFIIIDNIYKNQPVTSGFDRLWDNYFQQLSASKATRRRKDDFKKIIYDFVKDRRAQNIRIMDLGSGPAREIKELLDADSDNLFSNVVFDCYDLDIRAIDYAKRLLNPYPNINFFQKNAIRIALKKDVKQEIEHDYDLIYSTGLFDYFDERIAVRLIANLKRLLKKGGIMAIANFGDKYSNSSVCLMEWATEWNLIYRTESEFRRIFIDGGFSPTDLQIIPQGTKIMYYCFARAD